MEDLIIDASSHITEARWKNYCDHIVKVELTLWVNMQDDVDPLIAVSYTHLDVYKRQIKNLTFLSLQIGKKQQHIQNEKIIILLPGNKIILFLTINIVWKSLNKFSSTLLLLKRKRLQVNYPFPSTDLHQKSKVLEPSTIQGCMQKISWFCLNLRLLSFAKKINLD